MNDHVVPGAPAAVDAILLDIVAVELDDWRFNEPARRFFSQQGFAIFNERMWARSPQPD